MKFSNRNALALAMGLVGVMMLSALATAAEPDRLEQLREQTTAAKAQLIATVDEKVEAAHNLWAKSSYSEAEALLTEVVAMLTPKSGENLGTLAQSRRASAEKDIASLRSEWASSIMAKAKKEAEEKRYQEAMATAAEAALIDPGQSKAITDFVEYCRRYMQAGEYRKEVDIKKFETNYEKNLRDIDKLLREAQTLYDNDRYDEARICLERIYIIDPFHMEATDMLRKVYVKLYTAAGNRKAADIQGMIAANSWNWVEPIFPSEMELVPDRQTEVKTGDSDSIYAKLERIIFPSVEFDEADVLSVIRYLNNRSKIYDPDKEGVSIVAGFDKTVAARLNKITMSFARMPMGEILRYLCQDAGLKYKIDGGSIFIGPSVDEMQTRAFPVRGDLIIGITGGDAGGGATDPMAGGDGLGGGMGGGMGGGATDQAAGGGGGGEGTGGGILGKVGEGTDFKEGGLNAGVTSTKLSPITSGLLKSHFEARGVRFDAGSSIAYDRRTNRLIVRNTVENLRRMDELLRQLDAIETPLVMIEIKLVEITEDDWQELGFQWTLDMADANNPEANPAVANSGWNLTQVGQMLGSSSTTADPIHLINGLKVFPNFGDFGGVNVDLGLTVDAVSRNSRAEVLSAPKVVTNSGSSASINLIRQYFFPDDWEAPEVTSSGNYQTIRGPTVEFSDSGTDVGILLKARPQVDPDNYTISLELHPEVVSYVDKTHNYVNVTKYNTIIEYVPIPTPPYYEAQLRTLIDFNYTYDIWMPVLTRRKVDVNVKVYDGETIVIGGMIENETSSFYDRWPGLGDVPLVGRLFSSQREITRKKNLLIFVTTRLVNNDGRPIRRNVQRDLPDFHR
jgi:general secretion pathway protein D